MRKVCTRLYDADVFLYRCCCKSSTNIWSGRNLFGQPGKRTISKPIVPRFISSARSFQRHPPTRPSYLCSLQLRIKYKLSSFHGSYPHMAYAQPCHEKVNGGETNNIKTKTSHHDHQINLSTTTTLAILCDWARTTSPRHTRT